MSRSILYLALVIPFVLAMIPTHATAISADLATRLGGNTTGIYYPMYDNDELPQVLAAKKAFPNVPFVVNINPSSGPGSEPRADIANAITQLKSVGAVVTAYVPTNYGNRTIAAVEGMILSYNKFYPGLLDGIMFDEVSNSCSEFTFYQTISNYARSLGYSYIRANPGTSICQADVPLFDHIAIVESGGYPSESKLLSRTYHPQYSKDVVGFGATIHDAPTYDSAWLHMATKYLKWVYITDQTEPNPYAVFPLYFNQYLADLSSLAGTKSSYDSKIQIPLWVKNIAKWWAQGEISDSDFVKGIEYLIQQDIIKIPKTPATTNAENHIPPWIKNSAGWWADGSIGDSDFVKGIQYLIQVNIIHINYTNMILSSTAFENNRTIPKEFTCDGADLSPPLSISGVPKSAKSLALIVDDPDAPSGTFTHWTVWNIPADKSQFAKGEKISFPQGKTSFGKTGYGGPCPPSGTHRYFFKIYSLDTLLDLNESSKKADLEQAMKDHIIEQVTLVGKYSRS